MKKIDIVFYTFAALFIIIVVGKIYSIGYSAGSCRELCKEDEDCRDVCYKNNTSVARRIFNK